MRRLVLILLVCVVSGIEIHAQIGVHDAAVTAKDRLIAVLQESLAALQNQEYSQLHKMARRLSVFSDLGKYVVPNPPRWRTHGSDRFRFTQAFNQALIDGDPTGAVYEAVSLPVTAAAALLDRLPPAARRAVTAQLATLDLADATAIAGVNETGQIRLSGRKNEQPSIDALQSDVVDPSNAQSATAVLEKISGAELIGARQRQARIQLLSAIVEQLLVDSKRDRDAETAAMNMQLVTWRDGEAANEAFVAGTGDALRSWRQP